jgi:pyruvate dehydrogenase E1 component
LERREALGGFVPQRQVENAPVSIPDIALFAEFAAGTGDREASSTMLFVRILAQLLRDESLGERIVPIVPDEARTFGMEALFRQYGIYSHLGQLYEPVDSESLTYYREARDGQLLEEGISEAGALSSFIAAGTAYATHGVQTLPFFVFYSIFGFQRVSDLIWAAGDQMARGFLIGATSGRTTLNGEGLQHQDGHSHLIAVAYPHVVAYDPAFGYELAVVIREGIRRMCEREEDLIYYLTVQNETYAMPAMPDGAEEGILRGLYRLRGEGGQVHLCASGSIVLEALKAREILQEYDIEADVWSATSWQQLQRDGADVERWNLRHSQEISRLSWVEQCFAGAEGAFVVASDYVKALPDAVARYFPRRPVVLGTDGFGRSESRGALRRFFEVDAATMAFAALVDLWRQGLVTGEVVERAQEALGIDREKVNPATL